MTFNLKHTLRTHRWITFELTTAAILLLWASVKTKTRKRSALYWPTSTEAHRLLRHNTTRKTRRALRNNASLLIKSIKLTRHDSWLKLTAVRVTTRGRVDVIKTICTSNSTLFTTSVDFNAVSALTHCFYQKTSFPSLINNNSSFVHGRYKLQKLGLHD